jgi:hypothetical protein
MNEKLGIVIPLKARLAARNWARVCESLSRTLLSVEGQSCPDFEAIVVGHDEPAFMPGKSVAFHSIETSIPALKAGGNYANRDDFDRILDKNRKIVRGMQLLQCHNISHWYYLDADDLLDRNFVEKILQASPTYGCVIDGGFLFYARSRRIIRCNHLSQVCGSTSVLADKIANVPETTSDERLRDVPWCRYPHSKMIDFFTEELRREPPIINCPLVSYVLEHGDNCSDEFRQSLADRIKRYVKPRLLGKRCDEHFYKCFSLPHHN